ncbi:transcription factor 24 [Canis lupus baileyi]|uniref:Transcription factor 24 n=2 Tax=Canis lupus familiaris TaxID=9615 RepID=A0A8C0NAZ2_CANLF|nr:transcription factor 24 [Canis lupus familiaris]XP_022268062.1 transcription factor 24 [Canis lupus familiaris]XP_022268063.1 transcription factor 24 [Canis lupus familiaris]XP_022268064.1 transcription factor 24 [Canis lupus familiaris]XP_038297231.1 transcription factor 24 [Canis lupus familiaris]XP_038297232.1 transcription factor 24 [Canis lupus familiaris]XP_038297233.1 transcription factor 24 [Canis lupus familiaris]XP_038297234.1 transcription factor 24 [Canis lupus familiaris]XP_|eukprot:XP_022268061.1 transcription factor 24 [Canis lupus familiaris]
MDRDGPASSPLIAGNETAPPVAATRDPSPGGAGPGPAGPGGGGARLGGGRPAAANAARERSRVQTLRHAFLELQRTLPSVPPDTKLSKLDVLLLATTYIAHLTRSLQDDAEAPADPALGALRGDGYLHPVKKWPMRSRLYIGATGQFLKHSVSGEKANHGSTTTDSQP